MKIIKEFFNEIDLGKKFPDHIDKTIFRVAFLFILIIQMIALTMTGFDFNPAWAECYEESCSNPFYMATGKICEQKPLLCSQAYLSKGEIIGNKPPEFVYYANPISWTILLIAFIANYEICKKRRDRKKLLNQFKKLKRKGGY